MYVEVLIVTLNSKNKEQYHLESIKVKGQSCTQLINGFGLINGLKF